MASGGGAILSPLRLAPVFLPRRAQASAKRGGQRRPRMPAPPARSWRPEERRGTERGLEARRGARQRHGDRPRERVVPRRPRSARVPQCTRVPFHGDDGARGGAAQWQRLCLIAGAVAGDGRRYGGLIFGLRSNGDRKIGDKISKKWGKKLTPNFFNKFVDLKFKEFDSTV